MLTDVENNHMDTKERRGGGTNREIGIEIYICAVMYKIDN